MMKQLFITGVVLLFGTVVGHSQVDSTLVSQKTNPTLEALRKRANSAVVTDLRKYPPASGLRELRLWSFGPIGTDMVRLWETPQRWWVCQRLAEGYIQSAVDSVAAIQQSSVPSKRIVQVWEQAVAAGMFVLPPEPSRPKSNRVDLDGFAWKIEWFDGKNYGVAEANNPQSHNSPDDQRFQRVVHEIGKMRQYPLPMCKNSP